MPRKPVPPERRRGDGSITPRRGPDGQIVGYQGALYLGRGPDGRQKRAYVTAPTEAEVAAALARLRRGRARGELKARPERVTVSALLDRWLDRQRERVAAGTLAASTLATYAGQVERAIRPGLGAAQLSDLGALAIEDWLVDLVRRGAVDSRGRRRDVSADYLRCVRSLLRTVLEYACDLELIDRNPARRVAGPPGRPPAPRTPYTVEETRAFLDAARGHRLGALCWILAYTGLRRGEARGLRWADLDLDAGTLTVSGQYQWRDGAWERLTPKSRAGVRQIPLPAELIDLLRQRRADQRRERLRAKVWADSDLIFTTKRGGALHANSITQALTAVCRAAGIPVKSPHHHRHGIATLLGNLRVPPRVAQALLGHASPAMSVHYQHSDREAERAAMDEIGRVLRD